MFPSFETSYSGIVSVGNAALAWYANYAIGLNGNENTSANVGQVVTGNAYYVYQDQNGAQSIIPTTYDFRTNISGGHQIFGGMVTATTVLNDPVTGTTSPTIGIGTSGSGVITYETWSGGSYYYIDLAIPNAQDTATVCRVTFANDQFTLPVTYSDANPIFAYGVQKNTDTVYLRGIRDGYNNGIGFTTIPTLHNTNIYIPYAPISSTNASYNDVKAYIVDWANDLSADLDLGLDFVDADFYDFDVVIETETETETESESGSSDGFQINYNEILSEGELESVLTQETYTIDEIETEIALQDYTISLPETESETEVLEVVQAVANTPALMSKGFSLLDSWHLSGLYTSLAVIAVIWNKILKG